MGCWGHTFWDSDECVTYLIYLFQHIGLITLPKQRGSSVAMVPPTEKTYRIMRRPMTLRHDMETYGKVKILLESLTLEIFQSVLSKDTAFKETFFTADRDVVTWGQHQGSRVDGIGLTLENMWTIVQMHVGDACSAEQLDSLADAFRTIVDGGTWSFLKKSLECWSGMSINALDMLREKYAAKVRAGILEYKARILNGQPVRATKLTYLGGPHVAMAIYLHPGGGFPLKSIYESDVWNAKEAIIERFLFLEPIKKVDLDVCSTCAFCTRGKNKLVDSESLWACNCHFVFYCGKLCQRQHWKEHRRLHKFRTVGTDSTQPPTENIMTDEECKELAIDAFKKMGIKSDNDVD